MTLTCFGCSPETPVRTYVVPSEHDDVYTTELLRDEFPPIPFDWDAPKSWVPASNDQFSKVAWNVGSIVDAARITVSDVSMGMGLVAQVSRWRGQLGIETDPEANPMDGTKPIKLNGATATYVALTGKDETIEGMMLPHKGKLWVFKYRSTNEAAKKHAEPFRTFCKTMKIADRKPAGSDDQSGSPSETP